MDECGIFLLNADNSSYYIKNKPLPEELMTHLPFKPEIDHAGILIVFIKGKIKLFNLKIM